MDETQALTKINEAINKVINFKSVRVNPLRLEMEIIFKDNLTEFKELLDLSRIKKTELYKRYNELLEIKSKAIMYSGYKNFENMEVERPPIVVFTFGENDMEKKLVETNNKIENKKKELSKWSDTKNQT